MNSKTSLPSAAFLIEMINIDYKLFLWLHRCGPTSTPNGSSSGNMWTTSSISSCQEVSSRCTRWCDSQEISAAHLLACCKKQKKTKKTTTVNCSHVPLPRLLSPGLGTTMLWSAGTGKTKWDISPETSFTSSPPHARHAFLGYFTPTRVFLWLWKSCSNYQPKF